MAGTDDRKPRQRLPPEDRREEILARAAEAFAAEGFGVTTRVLAERIGVTQALIYRYFASKEALVAAVLERRFLGGGSGPDPALLAGEGPLAERLGQFYAGFAERGQAVNVRLFLRAALDGHDLPGRYRSRLDARYLNPVIAALRREAGLPGLADAAVAPRERELALALHGGLVFLSIRREVYRMEFPLGHGELIAMQARVFLPGALAELRRIHGVG